MTVLELETTVGGSEASVSAEMRQRRDQALIDVERSELVQLLQEVRSLRHYLRQQRNDLRGPFPHQRPELSATEEHCLRLFRCTCVRNVVTVWRESLTSESLTGRGDNWYEAASDFDLVAQDNVAVENDEDAICCSAALIQLKSRGPGGSRAIRAYRGYFFWSET